MPTLLDKSAGIYFRCPRYWAKWNLFQMPMLLGKVEFISDAHAIGQSEFNFRLVISDAHTIAQAATLEISSKVTIGGRFFEVVQHYLV
jgi:hypothetical protein